MEHRVSRCVRDIVPSVIREMSDRAAAYQGVISLGIGEPDFDTPRQICTEALNDAVGGHTHYAASKGDPALVSALVSFINGSCGLGLDRSHVVVTHGAMGALNASLRVALEPGDEVLVPEPHFPSYTAMISFMGGKMVWVPTDFDDGFVLRPERVEAAITPRTRVLLVNSPNNPTGSVMPADVLDELARVAVAHDLLVISDEVYDRLVYRGGHESIYTRPGMSERTVVVNSFSKTFAMTGWRIGYCYGPPWFMAQVVKVVAYYTSCASSVGQRAALAALGADPGQFEAMASRFDARCRYVYERLSAMKGVRVHPPAGSFYIFPDVTGITGDSTGFAMELLDRERVVVVPGSAFGPSGRGCVRISCTVDMPLLVEAMDRIERFIERFGA